MPPMAGCPYAPGRLCEVTMQECAWTASRSWCPWYREEQARLRLVLEICRGWASRRRQGKRLEPFVWCHIPTVPVHCFGWPQDCPLYWERRYKELRRALGKRRVVTCQRCGHTFLPHQEGKTRTSRFCSTRCKNAASSDAWRRKRGVPVRERRIASQREQGSLVLGTGDD